MAHVERDLRTGSQDDTAVRNADWPSRRCRSAAARSHCQRPKAAGSSRGRSAATSIDSGEHSGILKGVMAGLVDVLQKSDLLYVRRSLQ